MKIINLLFADKKGKLYDAHFLKPVARWGDQWLEIEKEDLIPLPEGATLTLIPWRYPIGIEKDSGRFYVLQENPYRPGEEVWAVGALLPQGYTRTLIPGFVKKKGTQPLPLLGYTAVVLVEDDYYVCALKTDEDKKWNPVFYNSDHLEGNVDSIVKKFKNNRIIKQLARCSLEYGCFTAQNIFYRRWEGGIPVSPACNANCMGCISLQPSECCPAPQQRIDFKPEVEEITEIAIEHLNYAEDVIISFGQGCEGEPTLQGELLVNSIRKIRAITERGTININTNGSKPEIIEALSKEGLDSIRVSLISAHEGNYNLYYNPKGYGLREVKKTLKIADEKGVFTSINLLTLPGFTDREEEIEGIINLIKETDVKQIQIRNLNIDPDYFYERIPAVRGNLLGIQNLLALVRKEFPHIKVGNYSHPVK